MNIGLYFVLSVFTFRPVAGSCEHDNESSTSIKDRKFLDRCSVPSGSEERHCSIALVLDQHLLEFNRFYVFLIVALFSPSKLTLSK
jgi:hypothetical protein